MSTSESTTVITQSPNGRASVPQAEKPIVFAAFCYRKMVQGTMKPEDVLQNIIDHGGISQVHPNHLTVSQKFLKARVKFHIKQFLVQRFSVRPILVAGDSVSSGGSTIVVVGPFSEQEYITHRNDLLSVAGSLQIQLQRFPHLIVYAPIRCQSIGPKRYSFSLHEDLPPRDYHTMGHDTSNMILPQFSSPAIHPTGMYMMFVEKTGCYKKMTNRKAFIAASAHGMSPVPIGSGYVCHFLEEIEKVAQKYIHFPPNATVFPTRTTGFVVAGPLLRTPQADVYMDEFMFQVEDTLPDGVHMIKVFVGENGVHEIVGMCDMSNCLKASLHKYAKFHHIMDDTNPADELGDQSESSDDAPLINKNGRN